MAFYNKAKGGGKESPSPTPTTSSPQPEPELPKIQAPPVAPAMESKPEPELPKIQAPPVAPSPQLNQANDLTAPPISSDTDTSSISSIGLVAEDEVKVETELEMGARLNLLEDLQEGAPVETDLDLIYKVIAENKGKVRLSRIYRDVDLPRSKINYYTKILEEGGLVKVVYPLNPMGSPIVSLREDFKGSIALDDKFKGKDKKLLEKYTVISDYVVADVNIWTVPFENTPIYQVVPHYLSKGSQALIQGLITEMARIIPVKLEEITDPRKMIELKDRFYNVAKEQIKKQVPSIDDKKLRVLTGVLIHQSYGLGDMDVIMSDNWLEEVAINGSNHPITVYHRKYGWIKSTKKFHSEQEIYNFSSQIGRKIGKQINNLDPIMDAHLLTGDRVASTLFPISTEGNTLTIRRFSRNPWTVTHMLDPKNHTMSLEMMAFLWLCIQYELNFLVVGGTASGKTSVLNTLCSLIPPTNRVISIEDTREISLPDALHWNWVPMASRPKNAEGVGEVTMLDLMVASLRMRPDRIIVGEIRRKQQAEAMFEAMHTGHSVCATMHADTSEQIKRRLTQPPIDIPEDEIQALQLVLVQYRDRRRGIRRSLELAELLPGTDDSKINLNYLYRWRPRRDVFEKDNDSVRIYEDLNLHTGMTVNDLENDLAEKRLILKWLVDNNIRDINKVGQIMRIYYKYPKLLLDTINDSGSSANLPI